MPNKLQCEQPKDDMRAEEREALDSRIRDQVIQALGKPSNLRNVQVRMVWDDHYRVNVIVGENAGSVSVANSFLVTTDSEGSLIAATPVITKQY